MKHAWNINIKKWVSRVRCFLWRLLPPYICTPVYAGSTLVWSSVCFVNPHQWHPYLKSTATLVLKGFRLRAFRSLKFLNFFPAAHALSVVLRYRQGSRLIEYTLPTRSCAVPLATCIWTPIFYRSLGKQHIKQKIHFLPKQYAGKVVVLCLHTLGA